MQKKNIFFLGYRFLEDPTLTSGQRLLFESEPEVRKKMNILDDQQVRQIILDKINAIPHDVQVVNWIG